MNSIAIVFALVNAIALIALPIRWAPVPLLICACYMTLGQGIEIGSYTLTIIRMLIAVGVVRVIIRGERLASGINTMDKLMVAWAVWGLFSVIFHEVFSEALTFRLGLIYNACGIYFLLRIFCRSLDDVVMLFRITAIILLPVAVEMFYERLTMHNLFSALGGVAESPAIREGKIRAQGPFAHAILAGTIGAVCLPLSIALWHQYRKAAIVGIGSCLIIIASSASSGPIMSSAAAIGALVVWKYRHRLRVIRWIAIVSYVVMDLIMKAPAYYLIQHVDLTGGSTGWYRARLIESAFEHLNEWWLGGTDYTRHWMPTGVTWSADHTDITNHYLQMGVIGGLPLMLLFIAILVKGFSFIGQTLQQRSDLSSDSQFMMWALGASLFAHTVTFISVSYFDQSFVFIYLTLAAIGSVRSATMKYGNIQMTGPDKQNIPNNASMSLAS